MNVIVKHTEMLLTKHDCVIVPGLGGFITHKESAKLIGHRLFPPTTTITFNALLTHSDGLLAEAIMQHDHVDYNSALSVIAQDVTSLKQTLATEGTITLGRIGKLMQHGNGTLQFIPSTADFLPANMGLRPIYLSPLSEEKRPTAITIPLPQQGSQVWRYAAAVIVLGIITLFAPQVSDVEYNKAAFNFNIPSVMDASADVITIIDTPTLPEVEDVTSKVAANPIVEEVTKTPLRYHLIIASMPSYEAALEYCAEKGSESEPLRIISANGKHRIASHSFASNTEAFAHLDSVRSSGSNRKAWVLKATL